MSTHTHTYATSTSIIQRYLFEKELGLKPILSFLENFATIRVDNRTEENENIMLTDLLQYLPFIINFYFYPLCLLRVIVK
jgi:hypothetical protein